MKRRNAEEEEETMGQTPTSEVLSQADKVIKSAISHSLGVERQTKANVIAEGKKNVVATAYELRPYFNRPKKQHLCKLILVQVNKVRHHVYRTLIARNVPLEKAKTLLTVTDENAVREHETRKLLPHYGFGGR